MALRSSDCTSGSGLKSNGMPPSMLKSAKPVSHPWYTIPTFRKLARQAAAFIRMEPKSENRFRTSRTIRLLRQTGRSRGVLFTTYDDSKMKLGVHQKRFGFNGRRSRVYIPHSSVKAIEQLMKSAKTHQEKVATFVVIRNAFWFMGEHFFRRTNMHNCEDIINESVIYQMRRSQYYDMQLAADRGEPRPNFGSPGATLYPSNMKIIKDYLTVRVLMDDPIRTSISERLKREIPRSFSKQETQELEFDVTATVMAIRAPHNSTGFSLSKSLNGFLF